MFKGRFHVWLPVVRRLVDIERGWIGEPDLIIPNLVTDTGELYYLRAIFRNSFPIAGGANWKVGLCNQTPADTDVLATVTSEPTIGTGGYARQNATRDAAGWPTESTVNGHSSIKTGTLTFTAAGADFDKSVSRLFLSDVASGAGNLFAYSGALLTPVTVLNGQSLLAQYEAFMN